MKTKEKFVLKKFLIFSCFFIVFVLAIYLKFKNANIVHAISNEEKKLIISTAKAIDLNQIIENNLNKITNKEEFYEKQEELEYITKYRYSDELYKGTTQTVQEGRNGIQKITMKKQIDNDGNLIEEKQISAVVTKSSIDKIIEIGTKIYVEPTKKNIQSNSNSTNNLNFEMNLTKPSGFNLEQFKKMLTDTKDKNKIFEENSDYFYYIENEYNINGVFVAAIAIHESAWGTSRIAINKHNLFGYGAYDSNPYNGAYTFSNYSESIDLLARVLVKYYLNSPGTVIYDGQKASGKYYNGSTITGVNQKYATDKNWANCVYKHMQYLYNKI